MPDLVLMIAGQSNGTQMCTVPVAGCNPIAGTYVWSATWRPMTSSDGAGMIELANALRLSSGYDNVYFYDCCAGGSSIVPAAASPPTNCWQGQNSVGPLYDCLAQVRAGVKVPQFVVWMQGEQEALYSRLNPTFDIVSAYKTCIENLRSFLLGQWGVTSAQCIWMVTPVGSVSYGDVTYVRLAQNAYANSTPGVIPGPARDDLALLNEGGTLVHLTGPSCRTFADRVAPKLIAHLQDLDVMPDAATLYRLTALETASTDLSVAAKSLQSSIVSLAATVASASKTSAAAIADLTLQVAILGNQVNPPAPGTFGAGAFGVGPLG